MRRADTLMTDEQTQALLQRGRVARIATTGADGWPYVIPLLYVVREGAIWFHHTMAEGHLSINLAHDNRVCVEVDEPYDVFNAGANTCATSLACQSLVAFGRARAVTDVTQKRACFDALMAKYAAHLGDVGEYGPAFTKTAVYAIDVENITGKQKVKRGAE